MSSMYFRYYLPLGKGRGPSKADLNPFQPKCLAFWWAKRRRFVNVISVFWTWVPFSYIRMLCAKFVWKWPSGWMFISTLDPKFSNRILQYSLVKVVAHYPDTHIFFFWFNKIYTCMYNNLETEPLWFLIDTYNKTYSCNVLPEGVFEILRDLCDHHGENPVPAKTTKYYSPNRKRP